MCPIRNALSARNLWGQGSGVDAQAPGTVNTARFYLMSSIPSDHPSVPSAKLGLLLINLGTPDALDYWSMRRYLGEFLSDKRVVELPQVLWQLILQGPILTFRPKKSAAAYREIWNYELDESPLRTITRKQTERLRERFGNSVRVEFAMRYGNLSLIHI